VKKTGGGGGREQGPQIDGRRILSNEKAWKIKKKKTQTGSGCDETNQSQRRHVERNDKNIPGKFVTLKKKRGTAMETATGIGGKIALARTKDSKSPNKQRKMEGK